MMVSAKYLHVRVCVILRRGRPAGRKTRVATLAHDNYVSGETVANVSKLTRDVNGFQQWERYACMS